MKNHTITLNGNTYFTAQVIDAELGKTHDMTAIFMETEPELPHVFIDYYYGDPNLLLTAEYITQYNRRQAPKPVRVVTTKEDLEAYRGWVHNLIDVDTPAENIEQLYDTQIKVEVNGRAICIDFCSEAHIGVLELLDRVIEDF